MLIGRLGETAFGHMLSLLATIAAGSAQCLLPLLLKQFLIKIPNERPPRFCFGTLGPQRTLCAERTLTDSIHYVLMFGPNLKAH